MTAAGFRIADPGVIDWDPHPIDLTADEVSLQSLSETDETDRLRRAKAWLYNFLEDGPKIANDVKSAAKRAGIPTRSLWDAKKALKVVSVRPEKATAPHAGRFEWRLPQDDYFLDGETEMLLTPSTVSATPPGLDELIQNLHDPSWGMALGGRSGDEPSRTMALSDADLHFQSLNGPAVDGSRQRQVRNAGKRTVQAPIRDDLLGGPSSN